MDHLSVSIVQIWGEWFWPLSQFLLGLGLVIFVHELGHFTMAKLADIRVEEFALGFGPRLFHFKGKETDYRINLLPIGGYVRMAGQEDFRPQKEKEEADPRSFNSKSVGARLAVVSAGVFMNIVLAALLFVIVALMGIRFPAPIVGGTLSGFPAQSAEIRWQAPADGLREDEGPRRRGDRGAARPPTASQAGLERVTYGLKPGDRILKINGEAIDRFTQIPAAAAFGEPRETFKVTLSRRFDDKTEVGAARLGVSPLKDRLAFGILPAFNTTLSGLGNYIASDPFEDGDRVIAVNGRRIDHQWQIESLEETLGGSETPVTVLRRGKEITLKVQPLLRTKGGTFFLKDGSTVRGEIVRRSKGGPLVLRLPDGRLTKLTPEDVIASSKEELLDLLGMVPPLKILGVVKGSPAAKAGLAPGDAVEAYGSVETPTMKEFQEVNESAAGEDAEIVVRRGGEVLPPLTVRPSTHDGKPVVGVLQGVDDATPVAAHVREGSPAEKAGLRKGDRFTEVNGRKVNSWIELFNVLKGLQGKPASLTYERGGRPAKTVELGPLTPSVFNAENFHFVLFPGPRQFQILMGNEVKKYPFTAIAWGARETWGFIAMSYASLGSYFRGDTSLKAFSGPVGIGDIALHAARQGASEFLFLMAIISVSLAVMNFLPLPVVDGGHAVFLLIEKARGRPLPLGVQNAVTMVGLVFLVFVFFVLTWNDVSKILSNQW